MSHTTPALKGHCPSVAAAVRSGIVLAVCLVAGPCFAGAVTWQAPSTVSWVGTIDDEGLRELHALLAQHPVTHLALEQSGGGIRRVTNELIATVRGHHLATSARGLCLSACALVFLAGAQRRLQPAENSPTVIGIHGYYDAVSKELVPPTAAEIEFVVNATGGRITNRLARAALTTRSIRGGLIVVQEGPTARDTRAALCDAEQGAELSCELLHGETATSLGIVTRD